MTKISHAVTVLEWITLEPNELKRRNQNPKHRVFYTGHARPLPVPWIETIGNWAGDTWDADFLKEMNKTTAKNFKSRYRLFTPDQFRALHGYDDWARAELSYVAIHAQYTRSKVRCSIGMAARLAHSHMLERGNEPDRLGMLPVELVLWSRVFDNFLCSFGLCYEDWLLMEDEERVNLWKDGQDDDPYLWHAQSLIREPAELYFHGQQTHLRRTSAAS